MFIRLIVVLLCIANVETFAKPFTLDKSIQPMRLELAQVKDQPGWKGGYVQGKLSEQGHYFYVKGHGMLQPIDVILETSENSDAKLEIYLSTWEKPVRQSSTGSKGITAEKFMVYGEFGIKIKGSNIDEPYLLTLAAASESVPALESPFVKSEEAVSNESEPSVPSTDAATESASASQEGSNTLMYVVITLLVVIAVLLLMVVFKINAKKSSHLSFLFCLLMIVGATAPNKLSADDSNRGEASHDINNVPEYRSGFLQPPPRAESRSNTPVVQDSDAKALNSLGEIGTKTADYLKSIRDGVAAWEAYQSLDTCMRIASPPNTPTIPSYCAAPVGVVGQRDSQNPEFRINPEASCSECFGDSRAAFNKARLDLEKLRVIYSCTKKMSNAAIAFGDTASGVHGYTGVAWQGIRYDIQQSVDKMEKAYDQKYPELIQNLHRSLIDMSMCEAQYGMEDWYDRIGFIYYEFMSDAYKRKD